VKISIAMATYNGANFLRQQLESFLVQTRLPDELVICDDGSRDETLEILQSFSQEAPFEVYIHRNLQNIGYTANFDKALRLCTGEIVFLSDQDDVWFPNKIECVVKAFCSDENLLLLINDAAITDKNLNASGLTQAGQYRNAGLPLVNFINGSCSAVSARLLAVILPIPVEEVAHDNWIHKIGDAMGARRALNEILQYYRRHDDSASKSAMSANHPVTQWDLAKVYFSGDARSAAVLRLGFLDRMSTRLGQAQLMTDDTVVTKSLPNAIAKLQREKMFVQARVSLLNKPRWVRAPFALIFWLRGGYHFFGGWKSLVKDIAR
jgi:hypothetical protein